MFLRNTVRFRKDLAKGSKSLVEDLRHKLFFVLELASMEDRGPIGRLFMPIRGLPTGVKGVEIDVGGAFRAIGLVEGQTLRLMRFGRRELVPRFVSSATRAMISSGESEQWVEQWVLDRARTSVAWGESVRGVPFAEEELSPAWCWYLDDEQSHAFDEVVGSLEERLVLGQSLRQLVLGAAGTGKTSLLVTLARYLSGLAAGSNETWRTVLVVNAGVARQLERFGEIDVPMLSHDAVLKRGIEDRHAWEVLLVDDPSIDLIDALSDTRTPTVVGLDPSQLPDQGQWHDGSLPAWTRSWLSTCYRQRQELRSVHRPALLELLRKDVVPPASQRGSRTRKTQSARARRGSLEKQLLKSTVTRGGGAITEVRIDLRSSLGRLESLVIDAIRPALDGRTLSDYPVLGVEPMFVVWDAEAANSVPAHAAGEFWSALRSGLFGAGQEPTRCELLDAEVALRGTECAVMVLVTGESMLEALRTQEVGDLSTQTLRALNVALSRPRDVLAFVAIPDAVPA